MKRAKTSSARKAARADDAPAELPEESFATPAAWERWLARNHERARGLWLRLAKKGAGVKSVTYAEAVEIALCYGWIDGQSKGVDEPFWKQKFTPRTKRSIWSKINCAKVEDLIRRGRMKPAGLAAVESAKQDGRWEAAYEPASRATTPADFEAALEANAKAKAAFAALDRANRYAILFRLQRAQREETRRRRIAQFVEMLARGEKIHR